MPAGVSPQSPVGELTALPSPGLGGTQAGGGKEEKGKGGELVKRELSNFSKHCDTSAAADNKTYDNVEILTKMMSITPCSHH